MLSDVTGPGDGNLGLGHVFPRQDGSYFDLTTSMTNLINFGAYGVPLTGTNLCGYTPETSDEELCARYFQLAVVSPLAVMNTIGDSLDFMPFNFSAKARSSVVASLQQRLGLTAYMRAQLYQISLNGGSLVSPLFTWQGFTEDVQKASDLSGVMFGSALRAEFPFKQYQTDKIIRFPANSQWVRLYSWETISGE